MSAVQLNRLVQIRRFVKTGRSSLGTAIGDWENLGDAIPASRSDISDEERLQAGAVTGTLASRFVVRSNSFSRGITRADELENEGITFKITGIKEAKISRGFLEISALSESFS